MPKRLRRRHLIFKEFTRSLRDTAARAPQCFSVKLKREALKLRS